MAEDVRDLLIRVNATTELLRQNLSKAEAAVADFERDTQARLNKVDGHFGRLGSGLAKLNSKFASATAMAGGFLAALGVGSLIAVGKQALDYASSLGEVSQQLGVTTRDLQVYRFAATQVGIEQEEMDTALAKLSQNLGKAGLGAKAQSEAFAALGISIRDSNGNLKTAGQVIPEIADKLAAIKSPAERAAVLVTLFGRSGQKLETLLSGGRGQIDELANALERTGRILSDEQIQKADETADKFAELRKQLETDIAGVIADNADAILSLANALASLVIWLGRASAKLGEWKRDYRDWRVNNLANDPTLAGSPLQKAAQASLAADKRDRARQGLADAVALWSGGKAKPGASGTDGGEDGGTDLPQFLRSNGGGRGSTRSKADTKDPITELLEKNRIEITNGSLWKVDEFYKEVGIQSDGWLTEEMERIDKRFEAERDARIEAAEEAWDREQQQIDSLATIFEAGFRNGTKGIWNNFKQLGEQIIAQLLAKFVISGFGGGGFNFGDSLGSIFSGLGFAEGGSPPVGKASMVGERGPELFVPKVPGSIIPNHALNDNGASVSVVINAPGATAETVAMIRREIRAAAPTIVGASVQATSRTQNRRRLP